MDHKEKIENECHREMIDHKQIKWTCDTQPHKKKTEKKTKLKRKQKE